MMAMAMIGRWVLCCMYSLCWLLGAVFKQFMRKFFVIFIVSTWYFVLGAGSWANTHIQCTPTFNPIYILYTDTFARSTIQFRWFVCVQIAIWTAKQQKSSWKKKKKTTRKTCTEYGQEQHYSLCTHTYSFAHIQ